MTHEEIIKLARKAGIAKHGLGWTCWEGQLERFAALVVAAERNRAWTQDHWTEYERSIAAAECEACAKIVEDYCGAWDDEGYALAAAIRARK